jgi:dTDP-4-amino-4,6-dideoxy-D-galactose acyltransferase
LAAELLEPLSWDTQHLGRPVARIRARRVRDHELDAVLCAARAAGIALVYWQAETSMKPDAALLNCHGGALVDRKAVFWAELDSLVRPGAAIDDFIIAESSSGSVSEALFELAIAAGRFSRFRVDMRYPRAKFEALYRQWLERSLRREIADCVYFAQPRQTSETPLGLVTVAVQGGEGSIGLIAVHTVAQRRGLASRLLGAAHEFMRQRGATSAKVVTQLANEPACRLYERAGYDLVEVSDFYHFWLHPARMLAA